MGLGAFGAHGLQGMLASAADAAERTGWWETAAHYHLLHAVAIVAVGAGLGPEGARGATRCFALGVVVFSGTLYAMALGAPRWFGAITPLGGVLLMAGWALALLASRRSSSEPGEGGAPR
ncbi:MAG: DUF423 domain-containing protein [Planctomycetota bacterium]